MTNETNTTATADREAFENWCRSTFGQHTSLVRSPDVYAHAVAHPVLGSTYANLQMLWEAWQASRAQAAQAVPDQQEDPHWRWLALQFDEHRMQALGWLKATLNALPEDHPALADARAFLAAPPLSGEEVLAKRIAAAPSAPIAEQKPVAWWIPKAEQFCLAKKNGERPFAKAWEPLYAAPSAPVAPAAVPDDVIRKELVRDLNEVFEPKGAETPQIVRDVIEYTDSWLSVFIQKRAETAPHPTAPSAPAQDAQALSDEKIEEIVRAGGGYWAEESYWRIEDADLHPIARALAQAKESKT